MHWCSFVAAGGQALSGSASASTGSIPVHPLVGAYYYLWNPENFAGGTLRAHLEPPQLPAVRPRELLSPGTAARDITNARQAGINFFAIDWWPYDAGYSGEDYQAADGAMKDFLAAPDISQMRFAMFYETWNLGFNARERIHAGHVSNGAALRLGHGALRRALLPQSFLSAH